ncbi:MAG: hypothetical protein GX887_07315 [Firmicutes bacterium]|nr:hypothetical protein [Bacillota bacterium]
MKRKIVILFIGIILALAVSLVGLKYIGMHIDNFNRQMEEVDAANVDPSMLADGCYTGVGRLFLISARVEVTIK